MQSGWSVPATYSGKKKKVGGTVIQREGRKGRRENPPNRIGDPGHWRVFKGTGSNGSRKTWGGGGGEVEQGSLSRGKCNASLGRPGKIFLDVVGVIKQLGKSN